MALLESESHSLGEIMPSFELVSAMGETYHRDDLMGQEGIILVFTCNHCPYAVAIWDRVMAIPQWATGFGVVAINPNIHPDYPADSPDNMRQFQLERGFDFPYLIDSDQSVARAYQAVCTPEFYLLNSDAKLVYHGRLDDSWQDPAQITEHSLQIAVREWEMHKRMISDQYPSMGCSIKWCR